jgi:hypothetical protein
MSEYTFTVMLPHIENVTPELETALFEAGCDDALVWSSNGKVGLDFTRQANSREEAIGSALADLRQAGIAQVEMV